MRARFTLEETCPSHGKTILGFARKQAKKALKKITFCKELPSPPCPAESVGMSIHDTKIPPPPPSRTSSRRGLKKSDDHSLAAYKECTRSTSKGKLAKKDGGSGLKKGMFNLSCKQSCRVRNDILVRVSQLPLERDRSGMET